MATDSDGLCSVCTNIDLKEYFRREVHVQWEKNSHISPNQDALRLGYLKDIGFRSESCPFCRLIIDSLCKKRPPSEWLMQKELLDTDREDGIRKECYLFSYLYADNRGPNTASVDSLVGSKDLQRAYRIRIAALAVPYLSHWGDIELSATSAAQHGIPGTFHGRVFNSERVDMGMVRDWLIECESHHKQKCSLPGMAIGGSASTDSPRDILVVDVVRMCLCQMPQASRYIALSYCWPEVNTFVTTKSMKEKLTTPGALRDKEMKLIQTIQDAIQCVSELGEEYLWVDALCIIQDDEEHKSAQIQQMDRVYGCSLLTLIHAPPCPRGRVEGYKGFVGYRNGSRIRKQDTYQVQGMELLVPLSDVDSATSGTRWTSRAWTYQEDRLSRRKLYFTESQVYFQCSCAVFCEDSVGEGISPSAYIYPNTNQWNLSGLYSSFDGQGSATWLPRDPIDDPVKAVAVYSRLLDQFSGRQMSNPRDIIASFEGILSVLRRSLKTDFWFGLPERYLDETILWRETGSSLRRNVTITPSSKTLFPSWSWAGWDTAVELEFLFSGYIYPEVEWYVIRQSGEAIQLVTPGSYHPLHHPSISSGNRNVRPPARPPNDFLKTVQHQAGISGSKRRELPRFLACWTCIALFSISDEKLDVDEELGTTWKFREHLPILDNVGHWAGSMFMGQGWKSHMKGNGHTFEFMLLSRSSTLIKLLRYFDTDVFTAREWGLLNVMLIQRDGDRAQRVGIGVIHEDAWVEASPVPMLIKLE